MGKRHATQAGAVQSTPRTIGQELANPFQLRAINLAECLCRQNLRDGKLPDQIANQINTEIAIDEKRTSVRVALQCMLRGSYADTPLERDHDPDKVPLFIHAKYQVFYAVNSDAQLEGAELAKLAHVNAPFHAFTYWREFVQSMVSRMGLPSLTLPLLKASDLLPKQDATSLDASSPQAMGEKKGRRTRRRGV